MHLRSLALALVVSTSGASLTYTPAADARRAFRPQPALALLGNARDAAGRTSDPAALATQLSALAAALPGTTVEPPSGGFVRMHLATGISALQAAGYMGFARPYAISGDVHQTQWFVVMFGSVLSTTGATQRIATETPHIGAWDVRLYLDGRPVGALPPIVAGASPAYDLQHYAATVVMIEFAPHH